MRRSASAIAIGAFFAAAPSFAQEEEIIDDPMLAKPAATPGTKAPAVPTPPKAPAPQIWRLSVFSRGATQTSWDDLPGGPKDVVEWRTRAIFSAGDKPSERLKWEVGVRFDALARARKHGDPAFTFEARPWEAS